MKLAYFLAATILCVAGLAHSQTTLTQTWKFNFGERDAFKTTDFVRGLAYNPVSGNLLLNNRVEISRFDADDGTTVSPAIPATGYTGGTFLINKVGVAGDGAIFVSNLASAAGGNFRIYRHSDEASAPTMAYTETTTERMGDDMAITGSGANTKILVAGASTAHLHIFTTIDGLTFTKQTISPTSPVISGTPAVTWDLDGVNFWFRNTEVIGAQKYDGVTYTGIGGRVGDNQPLGYGPIGVANIGSLQLLAVGIGNSSANTTGKTADFFDTSNNTKKFVAVGTEFTGGAKANLNGSGDVVFDIPNSRVFFLYTNNSVSSYALPPAGISEWNRFQ